MGRMVRRTAQAERGFMLRDMAKAPSAAVFDTFRPCIRNTRDELGRMCSVRLTWKLSTAVGPAWGPFKLPPLAAAAYPCSGKAPSTQFHLRHGASRFAEAAYLGSGTQTASIACLG